MTAVADIVRLAREAHAGQVDKQERDYFDAHLRPIAEGAHLFGEDVLRAAWLHDILEDTSVTPEDLLARGVAADVITAVGSVTKQDGEPYPDLIQRSAADVLGRFVKLSDNAWNIACSPALAAVEPERAEGLLAEKYLPAREVLLRATDLTVDSEEYQALVRRLELHVQRLAGALSAITLTPRHEGRGWVVHDASVNEVYENEHGLVFLTATTGGDVDSYLSLPNRTYPAIRSALGTAESAEVLPAVADNIAGILAVGPVVWAEAHGIETDTFTYASNDFWTLDD